MESRHYHQNNHAFVTYEQSLNSEDLTYRHRKLVSLYDDAKTHHRNEILQSAAEVQCHVDLFIKTESDNHFDAHSEQTLNQTSTNVNTAVTHKFTDGQLMERL